MQDRVPLYPGRVTLTPVAGQANTYDMARADQPTQEGTPLNKSTLLTDAVASMFGFGTSAVPNDMFNVLTHAGDLHVWKRTQDGVVDYPVSPNRNAYQEGSDAQPAGYTLGAVQSGSFQISPSSTSDQSNWQYSNTASVTDDGVVSLDSPSGFSVSYISSQSTIQSYFRGNFVVLTNILNGSYTSPSSQNKVYFIPNDAVISQSGRAFYVNKYQPVTGYPAVPAGTTIEYMGQLGNKARIEAGSYVGTGAYGESNPNSLTFGFEPKVVFIASGSFGIGVYIRPGNMIYIEVSPYSTTMTGASGKENFVSIDGNTISWYNAYHREEQLNVKGKHYYYVAFA